MESASIVPICNTLAMLYIQPMSSTRMKFNIVHMNSTDIASDTNSGALRALLPLVSRAELTKTAKAYAKNESPAVFPTQLKSPVQ